MEGLSKTPDEIKKALRYHFLHAGCAGCCYKELKNKCQTALFADIREYIRQLERERDALAALYKPYGTCGSCKHNESKICDNCINKDNRWEWAGIKEDNP